MDYTLDFECKPKICEIVLSSKNIIESEIFAADGLIKHLVQREKKNEDKDRNTSYGSRIFMELLKNI